MSGLARRLVGDDADDVVQDALLTAWKRWHLFDAEWGTPRAWLLTLTARAASRVWRTKGRRPVELFADLPDALTYDTLVDVDLRRAVQTLSARQRVAVELVYYLDLPIREAADVMECAPGTVKSTLADARVRLRTQLERS